MSNTLLKLWLICLGMWCISGCATSVGSNASACQIVFDYRDPGVNERNARALLVHYCLCHNPRICP